jgi:hypothetical protein
MRYAEGRVTDPAFPAGLGSFTDARFTELARIGSS